MADLLRVEIMVPAEYERFVLEDLERRGGRLSRSDTMRVIRGDVPAGALENYGNELRSMTGGAGTYRAYSADLAK